MFATVVEDEEDEEDEDEDDDGYEEFAEPSVGLLSAEVCVWDEDTGAVE